MKKINFCKIFIYALLNLICFLLSIIFLTSVFNIKKIYKSFENHYEGICAVFSFYVISFIFFFVVFLYVIKKDKFDNPISDNDTQYSIDNNENYQNNENNQNSQNNQNNQNNQNDQNNQNNQNNQVAIYNNKSNNEDTSARRFNTRNYNHIINSTNGRGSSNNINNFRRNDDEEKIENFPCLMNCLFISFIVCQVLYFIELIVLSAYLSRTITLKEEEKKMKEFIDKYILKTYTDLLIVGYIFFAVFLICYIYLFLLKISKRILNALISPRWKCFDNCILAGCDGCIECLKKKTINNEEFRRKKEKLEEYRQNLSQAINSNILSLSEPELETLNLFKIRSVNN